MTLEEVVKAMHAKQSVYCAGAEYKILYCKESNNHSIVMVERQTLNGKRYKPIEMDPQSLTLGDGHV